MARYEAQVWVNGELPYQVEVNAPNYFAAKKQIIRREGVKENEVNRIFEVRGGNSSSSSSSSSSGGGAGAIVGLGILLLPLVIIGNIVGGGNDTPTAPTYNTPAPIESTYTPQAPDTSSWDNGPCVTDNFEPC